MMHVMFKMLNSIINNAVESVEPAAPQSRVKHSTTEPLRSCNNNCQYFFTEIWHADRGTINMKHCRDMQAHSILSFTLDPWVKGQTFFLKVVSAYQINWNGA